MTVERTNPMEQRLVHFLARELSRNEGHRCVGIDLCDAYHMLLHSWTNQDFQFQLANVADVAAAILGVVQSNPPGTYRVRIKQYMGGRVLHQISHLANGGEILTDDEIVAIDLILVALDEGRMLSTNTELANLVPRHLRRAQLLRFARMLRTYRARLGVGDNE